MQAFACIMAPYLGGKPALFKTPAARLRSLERLPAPRRHDACASPSPWGRGVPCSAGKRSEGRLAAGKDALPSRGPQRPGASSPSHAARQASRKDAPEQPRPAPGPRLPVTPQPRRPSAGKGRFPRALSRIRKPGAGAAGMLDAAGVICRSVYRMSGFC